MSLRGNRGARPPTSKDTIKSVKLSSKRSIYLLGCGHLEVSKEPEAVRTSQKAIICTESQPELLVSVTEENKIPSQPGFEGDTARLSPNPLGQDIEDCRDSGFGENKEVALGHVEFEMLSGHSGDTKETVGYLRNEQGTFRK